MLAFEIRWTRSILEAFAPPENGGLSPTIGEVDYLGWFQAMRAGSPPLAAFGLRLAVWIFALSPLWHLGRLRTFASLPILERAALLERFLAHRWFAIREFALLLKMQASFSLLGTATVRARSGYDRTRGPARPVMLPVVDAPSGEVSTGGVEKKRAVS